MKNKHIKLAAVTLLGMITLAGCSSNSEVASMKGGKITEEQFFDKLKEQATSSDVLTGLIINKVTMDNYGKDVKDSEVDEMYKDYEDQYGGKKEFEDILKQNNQSPKIFKDSIKQSLAFDAMLKAHLDISDEDLKAVWTTYHPEVETQIISFDSEKDAKDALKKIKDGDDFGEIAKEKSTEVITKEDGGKVTFDSTYTTVPENVAIPEEVKVAAYELEDGKVSEVITTQNPATGEDIFYVVKMIKNQKKGNDYKPFKDQLTTIAEDAKMSDAAFQQKVIGDELAKANVKIKDEEYKDILLPYLPQPETKSTDTDEDVVEEDIIEETTESTK